MPSKQRKPPLTSEWICRISSDNFHTKCRCRLCLSWCSAYQLGILQASREVTATLSELGLDPVEGYLMNEGLTRVDVALPSRKVAFALDSEQCFSANHPKVPLGKNILEWHLLSLMQWRVNLLLASLLLCTLSILLGILPKFVGV